MRKLFLLFIALTLNAALWAQTQTVSYLYPEYNTEGDATSGIKEWQTDEVDATVIADTTTTLNAGWYVVTDDNVQTGTLTCNGAVHLILADGAKLTATGISGKYVGIIVSGTGNSLTIYGQAAQTGQLIANAATDMPCAGIGGGKDDDGSNITINGGIVTANAGKLSAGIGGGMHGAGSNITINGGMVTANGGEFGAGIGGGNGGSGFNITINGGTIAANGGQVGNGIGGGNNGSSSNITVATNLDVRADSNYPPATEVENDGGDIASKLAGCRYVTIVTHVFVSAAYIDAAGVEQTCPSAIKVTNLTTSLSGWCVVADDVKTGPLTCNGAVHLILADGAKLTATGRDRQAGIQVSGADNSLTIYGQTAQTGQLIVNGGYNGAGIGGGYQGSGSDITINGGIITANGGYNGAGVGGGFEGTGSDIIINNGTVTASGGGGAACLGGGWSGNGSNITVATNLYVRAGSNYPPTTLIDNDGTDIASKLAGSRYATIETTSLADVQAVAIAELSQYATDHPSTNGAAIVDTFTGNINAAQSTLAVADQLAAGKAAIDFDCLKDAAIAEINAAIEGLTLFQAEQNYIGYMIDDIRNEDDENLVKLTKQTTLEYIALHPAKLAAIADVKTAMGDLAESVIIYNYIGCLAIESAHDVSSIAEAKNAALAKMEEMSEILGAAYNIGDAAGYQRAFDELPTDPQDAVGTKVTITKGDKELKLVNPEKVEFGKQE